MCETKLSNRRYPSGGVNNPFVGGDFEELFFTIISQH